MSKKEIKIAHDEYVTGFLDTSPSTGNSQSNVSTGKKLWNKRSERRRHGTVRKQRQSVYATEADVYLDMIRPTSIRLRCSTIAVSRLGFSLLLRFPLATMLTFWTIIRKRDHQTF